MLERGDVMRFIQVRRDLDERTADSPTGGQGGELRTHLRRIVAR